MEWRNFRFSIFDFRMEELTTDHTDFRGWDKKWSDGVLEYWSDELASEVLRTPDSGINRQLKNCKPPPQC